MRRWFLIAFIAVAPLAGQAQADIGLKCSQWLDLRYDPQTKQIVDERPATAPPVPMEIDALAAQANWYLAGSIAALVQLDAFLRRTSSDTTGAKVDQASGADIVAGLSGVDQLCRGGLATDHVDYDVANIIDLHVQALMTIRMREIADLLESFHEAGRRQGAKP